MPSSDPNPIILYDGVCGLCNRLVQFALEHDSKDRFRLASLQSDFAGRILQRHGTAPDNLDTMYVVLDHGMPGERLVSRSDAAILILQEFGGIWHAMAAALRLLPRWSRDGGYNLIARNRYRIFGKYDSCPIPNERDRRKFPDLK